MEGSVPAICGTVGASNAQSLFILTMTPRTSWSGGQPPGCNFQVQGPFKSKQTSCQLICPSGAHGDALLTKDVGTLILGPSYTPQSGFPGSSH